MSIHHQILGSPGRDNALFVTVDSGHSLHRLLFDCGEGCLAELAATEVRGIDALFFSHFHMDHVAGFDSFLRANWDRAEVPVRIFGPPGTIEIIHHRLRGFIWNLSEGSGGEWLVTEIDAQELRSVRLRSDDGFANREHLACLPRQGPIYCEDQFAVSAVQLDHGTPSMGYLLREADRTNVAAGRLAELDLKEGSWIKQLKDLQGVSDEAPIVVGGRSYRAGELRALLLDTCHGDSIAYLTDFRLGAGEEEDHVVRFLEGCRTLVCENNYRDLEVELATNYHHMNSREVARLAGRVRPDRLVLFHLSDRYTADEWQQQLEEVRGIFASAEFPAGWF
jgi:ribonuclease Z